jgi:hypothetical protein
MRAEGLLLQIETEEAELAQRTAMTAMWSAYQEVAALAQEKARVLGLMVEDSPDNALTRPHFLQARLEAAAACCRRASGRSAACTSRCAPSSTS